MKAMKAMKLPNDMKQTSKAMKSMKASSSNTKNKTMKAMKGKACQKPGCTSWVWLRAPSPPKGPHGRKATKAGAKAK